MYKFFLSVVIILSASSAAAQTTETFTTAGTFTNGWTAPAGVVSVTCESWGGGGAGGQRSTTGGGGGGGGGAYAKRVITVTPGNSYTYIVGAAGTTGNPGTPGGLSRFIGDGGVKCEGAPGQTVPLNTATGGTAGTTAASDGSTLFAGGAGATSTGNGMGGGGSGGTASTGTTATTTTGATAVSGGGKGGDGTTGNAPGSAPTSGPAGGGGGARRSSGATKNGGAGFAGQVRLTYTAIPATPTGLGATPGNVKVDLTWNSVSGATSYNIYRSLTAGNETSYATGIGIASYTDNGVSNGTTYYYKVSAVNSAGESALSSEVNATPNPPAAGNLHVRTDGSGSANCADWGANACTLARAKALWVRGDSIWIGAGDHSAACSGSPLSFDFDTAASGTTLISVYAATVASHGSATGWDNAYGVDVTGPAYWTDCRLRFWTSYWLFDGQRRASTTTGHGFKITSSSVGLVGLIAATPGGTPLTNLTIRYADLDGVDSEVSPHGLAGFYMAPTSTGSSDVLLQYLYIHDQNGGPILTRRVDNFTLEYSYLARNFNDAGNHSEAVSAGLGSNHVYRYNTFADIEGTAVIVNLDGTVTDWKVYGNIFFWTGNANRGGVGSGIVADNAPGGKIQGFLVYNNTVFGIPEGGSNESGIAMLDTQSSGADYRNNLWFGASSARLAALGPDNTVHDYNHVLNTAFTSGTSLSAHETQTNSGSSDPFINSAARNFHLVSNTTAGANLGAPYNVDPDGVTRSTWSRGAFEYAATSATVSLSTSSLTFPQQTQNTTSATQTVTLTNTGGTTLNISGIVISGAQAAEYAFTGCGGAGGTTVAPLATCDISVTFTPTVTSGTRIASVDITSNAATIVDHITLSGTAGPPPAVVTSFSTNFRSIIPGASATLSYTTQSADISCDIDQGVGALSPCSSGTKVVSPTATTIYTLTAVGTTGSAQASVTIIVTRTPTVGGQATPRP